MKGLTHFVGAVATASCFPFAVQAGLNGEGTLLALSGICGILPDTLDFRGLRFLARTEIELAPDPLAPDLQSLAAGLAEAVRRAGAGGRAVWVKLDTMPVSGDRWRQYRVRFDPPRHRVTVSLGPVVTTGQVPVEEQTAVETAPVTVVLDFPIRLEYMAEITVDIFDGPILALIPGRDGRITIEFLPWHRGASHSLLTAVAVGAMGGVAFRSVGAGILLALAYASHILTDQLGFLGSRLFWPLSRRRLPGLQWTHAMDRFWNFGLIWTALVLIYANLAAQAPGGGMVSRLQLMVLGAAFPLALLAGLRAWLERREGENGSVCLGRPR
jgi:membrane-bound metal-dependent hydrolase YbcI (DUF457 family)